MIPLFDGGKYAIEIGPNSQLVSVAWAITVALAAASALTTSQTPNPLQWVLFAILLCATMIPFIWRDALPLRTYAGILLLHTLLGVFFWSSLPAWMSQQAWFPNPSGYAAAFLVQSPKVVAAFVMMAVLMLVGYRRQEFFVSSGVHGRWRAAAGVVAAVVMGFAILAFMQTTSVGVKDAAASARYLPLVLVLAAMNSFAEEMLYRGVLFGPLLHNVTANQAITMTAVLFGIAHYHGTPSGVPGIGLTFVAGWVFGLAMVETRSILLPWLLHFVPDAVIFVASALQNS